MNITRISISVQAAGQLSHKIKVRHEDPDSIISDFSSGGYEASISRLPGVKTWREK